MSSSPTDVRVDVVLPAMGTSITEGTIIGWAKQVGDAVARDETICEVSTDKVDSECPAPVAGVLAEILVETGQTVEVGTVIARLSTIGPPSPSPSPSPSEPGRSNGGGPRWYSPVVRRMALVHDIDLAGVPGTGRGGRVTKRDVLVHLEGGRSEPRLHSESPYRPDDAPVGGRRVEPATPSTPSIPDALGGRPEPLSRMRQAIGGAMLLSQQTTATCHTVVECDMSRVETRRRELGLTALPLIARTVVDVLRDGFGDLNATLDGATMTRYDRVHLGIAVSLGAEGLIVPVIRDAQDLAPEGLAARIKELAGRARAKQLQPDEVQGATFTITNPGRAGALIATPVIDVPQVAILDVEAIVRRPVVVADVDGNEAIAIRSMVNLVLGWDHRAVDGIFAAEFLSELRRRLERPS